MSDLHGIRVEKGRKEARCGCDTGNVWGVGGVNLQVGTTPEGARVKEGKGSRRKGKGEAATRRGEILVKQAEGMQQGLWGSARSPWDWNLAGKQAVGGADTTQEGRPVLASLKTRVMLVNKIFL